jgi:hypothetical protein
MHLWFANAFSLWNQPFVDTYVKEIEQNERKIDLELFIHRQEGESINTT